MAVGHPPLKGEGRTAEGSPGWGDSGAVDDGDASYAEVLSPPPGPLTRADLPPPGGGGRRRPPTCHLHCFVKGAPLARTHTRPTPAPRLAQIDHLRARRLCPGCRRRLAANPLCRNAKNHFGGAHAAVIEEGLRPVSLGRCRPPAAPRHIFGGRQRRGECPGVE